jgi:mRNA-degrading endonuclease RelE of RelBE toxin-antitoxin system
MKIKYNKKRLENFIPSKIDYSIKYELIIPPEVLKRLQELKTEKPNYWYQVNKLISITRRSPKEDEIKNISPPFIGFNRPEATHQRTGYDKLGEGREIWSKDIDQTNRLIYEIDDIREIITILSIEGHNLTQEKLSLKFFSEIDSEDIKIANAILEKASKGEWITWEEAKTFGEIKERLFKRTGDNFKNHPSTGKINIECKITRSYMGHDSKLIKKFDNIKDAVEWVRANE